MRTTLDAQRAGTRATRASAQTEYADDSGVRSADSEVCSSTRRVPRGRHDLRESGREVSCATRSDSRTASPVRVHSRLVGAQAGVDCARARSAGHGDGDVLTSYFFAKETDDYLLKLRRHCFLRGMPVSGTAIGNNFSLPKGPRLTAEIATTEKWIDRAVLLGAPHIRVFAGNAPKDFPRAEADKSVIAALEECSDYAGRKGIFLGLENHDSLVSAATILPIVQAVQSPWIGVNLDSGNFRTEDPYEDFAACVPYAVNVQFKADVHDGKGGRRDADLKRFTQLLRDGGYQGWVALEYEAQEDPAIAVPRLLEQLKELFAG